MNLQVSIGAFILNRLVRKPRGIWHDFFFLIRSLLPGLTLVSKEAKHPMFMPMIRCNVSYFPNFLNHACVYVCAHALSLMCERVGSNFLTYKIFSRAVVCSANSLRVPNAERLFKSCKVHMGPPRRLDFRATSRIMADVFLSPSNFASICFQYLIYFHI